MASVAAQRQNKIVQCVSCILFNQKPPLKPNIPLQVLLIQREKDPYSGRWTIPGGRHEPFETFQEATMREMREETGIEIDLIGRRRPSQVNEFINEHIHYMILTSFAIPKNDQMITNREDIVTKWFPIGLEPKVLD